MIIHVEGLDLAGKSTTCRRLKDRFPELQINKNRLCIDNPVHALADELRLTDGLSSTPLGHLFYAALEWDIERWREPSAPTLQDSTVLLRSIVYHEAHGNDALAALFRGALERHPKFTSSYVLTCDREVRYRRLEGRISRGNDAPEDHILTQDPERFFAMETRLIELATRHFDAKLIDTSRLEEGIGLESAALDIERLLRK
jgi:thymidylate kinase